MSLPDPQDYIILASESFGSGGQVGAVTLPSQNELRGLQGMTMKWTLSYLEKKNKGPCTITGGESGKGFLGVAPIDTNMDNVVRLSKDFQSWILKNTGNGFSISQVIDGEEMFLHLDNDGGKVRLAHGSEGIQSWLFRPV